MNELPGIVPYPVGRRPLHTMARSTIMRNNRFSIMHHVWRPKPPQVHLILTFGIQLRAPLHTASLNLCIPLQCHTAWCSSQSIANRVLRPFLRTATGHRGAIWPSLPLIVPGLQLRNLDKHPMVKLILVAAHAVCIFPSLLLLLLTALHAAGVPPRRVELFCAPSVDCHRR